MSALLVVISVIAVSLYASGIDVQTVEDRYDVVDVAEQETKSDGVMTGKEVARASTIMTMPSVVRVSGFGAFEKKADRKSESKRLMVMRASKLDAYRNMAERIYGITITGSSSVRDFALKEDRFGAAVDSVVRGARVVSITDHKDKGIETVLELLLPADFKDCLNKVNNFRNGSNCLQALPQSHAMRSEVLGDSGTLVQSGKRNRMQQQYFLK